ncbi:hypothetical protein GGX14DRAFT_386203 [Mycena pura]|uniref:Uncharacterized protein n=1 Tax=Mycena pura TaxID=153505 RepID=A0AAD6YNW3_9AGAR|nr:hypothetical protein GGX14DRAFT_386203 [Mycena pura]
MLEALKACAVVAQQCREEEGEGRLDTRDSSQVRTDQVSFDVTASHACRRRTTFPRSTIAPDGAKTGTTTPTRAATQTTTGATRGRACTCAARALRRLQLVTRRVHRWHCRRAHGPGAGAAPGKDPDVEPTCPRGCALAPGRVQPCPWSHVEIAVRFGAGAAPAPSGSTQAWTLMWIVRASTGSPSAALIDDAQSADASGCSPSRARGKPGRAGAPAAATRERVRAQSRGDVVPLRARPPQDLRRCGQLASRPSCDKWERRRRPHAVDSANGSPPMQPPAPPHCLRLPPPSTALDVLVGSTNPSPRAHGPAQGVTTATSMSGSVFFRCRRRAQRTCLRTQRRSWWAGRGSHDAGLTLPGDECRKRRHCPWTSVFPIASVLSIWTAVLDLTHAFWKSSVDPHQPIMLSINSHSTEQTILVVCTARLEHADFGTQFMRLLVVCGEAVWEYVRAPGRDRWDGGFKGVKRSDSLSKSLSHVISQRTPRHLSDHQRAQGDTGHIIAALVPSFSESRPDEPG